MAIVKQAGSFVDGRKNRTHKVFCLPDTAHDDILLNVIEDSDFEFYNLQGTRKVSPRPYDRMLLKDGAVEAAFTDDGDLVFMDVGTANPEDQ